MAKKHKKQNTSPVKSTSREDKDQPLTLKDLLGADVLGKLKAQADEMKQAETDQKEELRRQEEEKKKAKQKLLENDFSYLLENSDPSWSKHK